MLGNVKKLNLSCCKTISYVSMLENCEELYMSYKSILTKIKYISFCKYIRM